MGRDRTKLNPVIACNSMFIMSSFFLFNSSISSRVMSRVSMYERSSTGFFALMGSIAKDRAAFVDKEGLLVKASVVGVTDAIAIATASVSAIVNRKEGILLVLIRMFLRPKL